MGASDHLAIVLYQTVNSHVIHSNKKIFKRDWRKYNQYTVNAISNSDEIKSWMNDIRALDDVDEINDQLREIHGVYLNVLAPLRAFRTRDEKKKRKKIYSI